MAGLLSVVTRRACRVWRGCDGVKIWDLGFGFWMVGFLGWVELVVVMVVVVVVVVMVIGLGCGLAIACLLA